MLHMGELLRNWSFICIAQRNQDRTGQADIQRYDYLLQLNKFKVDMLKYKALVYEKDNDQQLAHQCLKVIELFSIQQR